jgi:aminoglycoside phosphotransferase (APT) family kinase protein
VLLPGLDELRSRGVPVPEYPLVLAADSWTLSAQQVLPSASVRNPAPAMVEQVIECVAAMAGVACPLPAPGLPLWGASVVHTLTVGVDGWAIHEPLRTRDRRSAAVLERVKAVGADADPAWFPTDGLVHLELHTDNVLAGDDGRLTGIIDWEGACAADPRFDLVRYAYDLDGHDQPVWGALPDDARTGRCRGFAPAARTRGSGGRRIYRAFNEVNGEASPSAPRSPPRSRRSHTRWQMSRRQHGRP